MDELMLRIDNVSKQYKLGQIGGTTLRDELQRISAKMRGKEDPTKRIGAKDYNKGETFLALDEVSFEVKKGERVGIIGHNGAGKSTLLKLISRVTAPTDGSIGLNGRIASMLEVGTGFHPELTGRENVYMNGAILGMTKKEIDTKMEDIIEFSEVRQFIDTPVKRYSSGMYVKLAFSVAAHLDSEIMIMDEVLAVGDINFQQKCLKKMKSVAKENGRTILYVSHNMNTIRQLCTRCIVLSHGKVVFNGDVDKAIEVYSNRIQNELKQDYDVSSRKRDGNFTNICHLNSVHIDKPVVSMQEDLHFSLTINCKQIIKHAMIRMVIHALGGEVAATTFSDYFELGIANCTLDFVLSTDQLAPGDYNCGIILCEYENDTQYRHDGLSDLVSFRIEENEYYYGYRWDKRSWGYIKLNALSLKS